MEMREKAWTAQFSWRGDSRIQSVVYPMIYTVLAPEVSDGPARAEWALSGLEIAGGTTFSGA